MAPPNVTAAPYACLKEIQAECYRLGIPLKTRHREVAPGQYEFAPTFGLVTSQIDQNLMVMQISECSVVWCSIVCLFWMLYHVMF
jgi:glutamine synthetase